MDMDITDSEKFNRPLSTARSTEKLTSVSNHMNGIDLPQGDNNDIQNHIDAVQDDKQHSTSLPSPAHQTENTSEENKTLTDYLEGLNEIEHLVLALQIKIRDAKTRYYKKRIEEEKKRLFDNTILDPDTQSKIKVLIDLIEARAAHIEQRSDAKLQFIMVLMEDDDDDDDDQDEEIEAAAA